MIWLVGIANKEVTSMLTMSYTNTKSCDHSHFHITEGAPPRVLQVIRVYSMLFTHSSATYRTRRSSVYDHAETDPTATALIPIRVASTLLLKFIYFIT